MPRIRGGGEVQIRFSYGSLLFLKKSYLLKILVLYSMFSNCGLMI